MHPSSPAHEPSDLAHGAVTPSYRGDREGVVQLLGDALATELVCVLRYRRHHFLAQGLAEKSVAAEFLAHSDEELGHADLLAGRILQLGGEPDLHPDRLLARSHAAYGEGATLVELITEDLVAERIAIDRYRDALASLEHDSTTRRLIEGILAVEEEHADDLAALLSLHAPNPAGP